MTASGKRKPSVEDKILEAARRYGDAQFEVGWELAEFGDDSLVQRVRRIRDDEYAALKRAIAALKRRGKR